MTIKKSSDRANEVTKSLLPDLICGWGGGGERE